MRIHSMVTKPKLGPQSDRGAMDALVDLSEPLADLCVGRTKWNQVSDPSPPDPEATC
jgi:hypothetical protein